MKWINMLEKTNCECSDTYHRRYIKKWVQIYIFVSTLIYMYNVYGFIYEDYRVTKFTMTFQIPFTFLSFVNVIISIHYIEKLKKINCKCSESLTRETYYIFNWLKVGLFGFFALLMLIITLAVGYLIASNRLSSWWFTFQNTRVELSNNGKKIPSINSMRIPRTKPGTPMSFSIPKTRNFNKRF